MSFNLPPSWVFLCALIPLGIYLYTGSTRRLPPGPPGLPLIGNLFDLPDKEDPIPWAAHRDKYGPISSVTVLGQHIILLNDLRTNIDLLDKRSSIYAGRPFFPFASGMVGWDQQLIMAQPGEHFRAMRRLLKSYVGSPATAASFQHVQETETRHFLLRVMRKPDDLIAQLRIAAGSIALQISHGYQVETEKPDILVSLVENAAKDFFHATMPGKWFIDIFPQMGRLPKWFNFHKVAAEYRKRNLEQSDRPYNFVKQQMAQGTAQPSFTSLALNDTTDPQTLYATKFAATAIYGGGSDPAVGALSAFILALVAFPQCQKRAQKEIDDVVGTKRLPNFSDRPNLPYIEAMMKETVRWQCTGRIGIPHRATEDDSYGGYDIPKDSLILPHMWNITHDPMLYSSPSEFRPERFLGDNPELDPATYLFGFGRRACPGEDLAKAHMFITMAMILAAFNIRRPWNEHREEIAPACEFLPGTVSHPRPFGYVLEVRSDEVTALIESIEDEAPQRPSDGDSV